VEAFSFSGCYLIKMQSILLLDTSIPKLKHLPVCSGGLFIQHHLQRHFLGSTRSYFRTPVLKWLDPLSFSSPFLPLFVKFRPCFARVEPSDVYGAAPSATALVIAYRAGQLCLD
jgi:hypothetical protein